MLKSAVETAQYLCLLVTIMGKNCVHSILVAALALVASALPAWSEPTIERVGEEAFAYLGQPRELHLEVRWHGAADAYMILPPEFEDVDWAVLQVGPSAAFTRDGENVVRQTVVLTPREVGAFEVPDIVVGYLTPGDLDATKTPEDVSEDQEPEREIPKLRLSAFTMEVRKDRTVLWIALAVIALGALLYLGGMGVFLFRRARESGAGPESDAVSAEAEGRPADLGGAGVALHEAKRNRVEGDVYAFYSSLAKAAESLGSGHDELAGVIQARAQKVGFQDYAPTEDEMETDYRAVSRVLRQSRDEDEAPASP